MKDIHSLLYPKSIAIVGASRDRDKLGRIILDNVLKSGFRGAIYPVNPKAKRIKNLVCYPDLLEIKKTIDLAVIAIPAAFVFDTVKDLTASDVKNVIVISAGYSEIGQDGMMSELKLCTLLQERGISLLGPNCLGIISAGVNLNATFAKNAIRDGNIAFLSQSGALGSAALGWAEETGVGFSHFVSIGNKADLSENDFVKFFISDESVKAIFMYLEDFVDGRGLMELGQKTGKPIVVMKPGISEEAQKALGSHTGSLAQDDLIVSAAMKQGGIIRVDTIENMLNLMQMFSFPKQLKGPRIAIVTNAGGPGVITTDSVIQEGLEIAALSQKTQQALALNLPSSASVHNPVDVLGDARADRYEVALKKVLNDQGVDCVLAILTTQVMTQVKETAEVIAKAARSSRKIIIPVFIGGKGLESGFKVFRENNMSFFRYPHDAVDIIAFLNEHTKEEGHEQHKLKSTLKAKKEKFSKMMSNNYEVSDLVDVERLLREYEIPTLDSFFIQDIAGARKAAKNLKYPLVMKLIHPELLHKTDVNAVRLNIRNESELEEALVSLEKLGLKMGLSHYKLQVQHFVKEAVELIVGVKRDDAQYMEIGGKRILRKQGFGHTLLFGMGGIYTEIYKDVSLRIVPILERDVVGMIAQTKINQVLKGARGQKYDLKAVKKIIRNINQLILDFPQIYELDINPLFVKESGVWAADVKMVVKKYSK
ncbi:MAG: acetate--CoA ligase family protein [Candidatus Dojkabacteria bacterium]|nr:acetate--CoA ligase family protein [Candidatus Dojkabacteria bacterium]